MMTKVKECGCRIVYKYKYTEREIHLDGIRVVRGDCASFHHSHPSTQLAPVRPHCLRPSTGGLLRILQFLQLLCRKMGRNNRLGLHNEGALDWQHLHHHLVWDIVLHWRELQLITMPAVKLFLVFIESGRRQLFWALAALQAPSVKRCPIRGHVSFSGKDAFVASRASRGRWWGAPTHPCYHGKYAQSVTCVK